MREQKLPRKGPRRCDQRSQRGCPVVRPLLDLNDVGVEEQLLLEMLLQQARALLIALELRGVSVEGGHAVRAPPGGLDLQHLKDLLLGAADDRGEWIGLDDRARGDAHQRVARLREEADHLVADPFRGERAFGLDLRGGSWTLAGRGGSRSATDTVLDRSASRAACARVPALGSSSRAYSCSCAHGACGASTCTGISSSTARWASLP